MAFRPVCATRSTPRPNGSTRHLAVARQLDGTRALPRGRDHLGVLAGRSSTKPIPSGGLEPVHHVPREEPNGSASAASQGGPGEGDAGPIVPDLWMANLPLRTLDAARMSAVLTACSSMLDTDCCCAALLGSRGRRFPPDVSTAPKAFSRASGKPSTYDAVRSGAGPSLASRIATVRYRRRRPATVRQGKQGGR
jgi:hypothetical protein